MESPQDLCELGQQQLMRTEYLEAEATLVRAEAAALAARDWDLVSRLYMPLQEARRQRRQRCGEGIVCLDLLAEGQHDRVQSAHVIENYPHGQLLVAGWGTIESAIEVRRLAAKHKLYVETYLAAVYPVGSSRAVVIVPTEDVRLPEPLPMLIDQLLPRPIPNDDLPVAGNRHHARNQLVSVLALNHFRARQANQPDYLLECTSMTPALQRIHHVL